MSKRNKSPDFKVVSYGSSISDRVILLFCPFAIPSWQLNLPGLPIRHFRRAGYRVIAYSYRLEIANKNPDTTLKYLDAIIADADRRISSFKKGTTVYCFGSSLGTVLAVNVAVHHEQIKKVVLNLSYYDIAEQILNLPPMILVSPKRHKSYITAGGGADGLHKIFDRYSPASLLNQLSGKQVLLYISRKDRLHRYRDTKNLPIAMKDAGVDLTYYENAHLSHYFSAFRNHLDYKKYMEFLN
jgi:pimeloyl-ACP methyl ester carboxylesterase